MNGNLHVILIRNIQAVVNHCRRCSPVLMDLQSHGTGFYLFDQRSLIGAVSFSEEAKIHRIFLGSFQHHLKIPRPRSTGCCVCSICRTGSASDHGSDTAVQGTVNLLRADEMNVGVNTTSCNDHTFSCKCLCRSTYRHSGSHTIHDIRVSRFSDSDNFSVFDSDIGLDNSCGIHNQGISNYKIQISVTAACFY